MLKIAITGPESTGKSSLAKQLASHYSCHLNEEYAREYIDNLKRDYTLNDIVEISRVQANRNKKSEGTIIICDTELIVTKIWAEYKYGNCPGEISQMLDEQNFDIYLLCDIDLPWEPDPQREHPDKRPYFFNWFKKELEDLGAAYTIISGQGNQRYQNAVKIIDKLLENN